MTIREDMPRILGAQWETSDNFDAIAKTPIGTVSTGTSGSGQWVALKVAGAWVDIVRGGSAKTAIRKADRLLRALLAAAVEPIAKRLDDRSQALLDARPTVDPVTALHYETLSDEIEECADLVRIFYARDAKENGDEGR